MCLAALTAGRLILCDAMFEAASETPDLLIDAATLTGAARVALGPEVGVAGCMGKVHASVHTRT